MPDDNTDARRVTRMGSHHNVRRDDGPNSQAHEQRLPLSKWDLINCAINKGDKVISLFFKVGMAGLATGAVIYLVGWFIPDLRAQNLADRSVLIEQINKAATERAKEVADVRAENTLSLNKFVEAFHQQQATLEKMADAVGSLTIELRAMNYSRGGSEYRQGEHAAAEPVPRGKWK